MYTAAMLRTENGSSGPGLVTSVAHSIGRHPAAGVHHVVRPAPASAAAAMTIEPEPWIQIVEQPKPADLRFRYKCEGRSAGSLLGEHSKGDVKTFPTIRVSYSIQGRSAAAAVDDSTMFRRPVISLFIHRRAPGHNSV
jgi:Rel homology DNA-binding domain